MATIGLLPVAHLKVSLWGIPLYLPEIPILLALFSLWLSRGREVWLARIDRVLLFGIGLFLLGALISFLVNPWSLTGLGMLKSWFMFPALFGWLLVLVCRDSNREQLVVGGVLTVLTLIAWRSLFLAWSGVMTYDGRLAGDYTSPNFLAFLMALGLPLLLWFPQEMRASWLFRSMAPLIALGLSGALLFTRSYGAIGAVSIVFLVWIFRSGRGVWSQKKMFLFLGLLVAGVFLLSEVQSEKWQSLVSLDVRSSFASREMIWRSALRIAVNHPLGIGVGRFQDEYLSYQAFFPPYLEWAVPEPHNLALAVFFATGTVGFIGFSIMLVRVLFLLWRTRASVGGGHISGLLASWGVFLLLGLVDTPLFKGDLAYLFAFLFALSLLAIQKRLPEESENRQD